MDDIQIVGFDDNNHDHDASLKQDIQICRKRILIKQRQMPFQSHQDHILWRDYIKKWSAARPYESACGCRNAPSKVKKRIDIVPRYN